MPEADEGEEINLDLGEHFDFDQGSNEKVVEEFDDEL